MFKPYLGLAAAAVLAVALTGCDSGVDTTGHEGSAPAQVTSSAKAEQKEPYTISEEAMDSSQQYATYITGTLVNNTDSDKSYIQVNYNLYDESGAQIGTALANTNNLEAGGTWKFKAMGTVEPSKVASWKLADVSGF